MREFSPIGRRCGGSLRVATLALFGVCALALLPRLAAARSLPPKLRASIIARVLAYDGKLKSRAGSAVVVGVVVKGGAASSVKAGAAMLSAFSALGSLRIAGLPLRVVLITFGGTDSLRNAVRSKGIDALYVCRGLGDALVQIQAVSRSAKVLTVAGRASYVKNGLAFAVVQRSNRPRIVINLAASKSEGAAFSSGLLQLAQLVK